MAMKNSSAPRRVYSTRGSLATCYKGGLFGKSHEDTAMTKDLPVVVEEEKTKGNLITAVVVKQRPKGKKVITETWEALEG